MHTAYLTLGQIQGFYSTAAILTLPYHLPAYLLYLGPHPQPQQQKLEKVRYVYNLDDSLKYGKHAYKKLI